MTNIRAVAFGVIVAMLAVGLCGQGGSQEPVWLQRLQRWCEAIERHKPGTDDDQARLLATWTRSDLRTLRADLFALRDQLVHAYEAPAGSPQSRAVTYAGHQFQVSDLQRLLGLGDDEARRGDLNRVLWPGALLHTDIAMRVPSEGRPVVGRRPVLRLRDGQPDGYEYPVIAQWEFARNLLDAIRPDPARDETVRLWYLATSAYLQRTFSLSDATAHLSHGRQLFPADADLLFLSGCVHEAYTAPDFQSVLRSFVPPAGLTLKLGSSRSHLQEAESLFRKALARNERLTEARVRLGRVLGLLDRHEEAAEQLRQAATTVGDSQVLYYAYMLLGEEEQALGHRAPAREWYERAAAIYKGAQSPLFALSQLALQAGDNNAATRAVERIRQLPADEGERFDPWFQYYFAAGRYAEGLFNDLLAAVPGGGKR